jgi:TonB family protein
MRPPPSEIALARRVARAAAALVVLAGALTAASPAAAQQSPGVTPPQVVEHVDAVYPPSRQAEGVEANVLLFVTVEKDGTVSEASVASSGGDEFDEAALAAIKGWKFAPATKGGAAARARIKVPFHFASEPHVPEPPPPPPPPSASKPPASATPSAAPPASAAPSELPAATNLPHAVAEPGKPIEIHVVGKPNPPRRSTSDFRLDTEVLSDAPHATAADLLQSAPGFVVGHPEGAASAQRIVLRGFDADHGQDVEFTIGAIPVNQISHLHGQGYSDLNVVIPETVRSVRVLEGVFDPAQGDFAVAGSVDYDLGVTDRGTRVRTTYGSFGTARALALWAPEGQAEETFAAASLQRTSGFGTNRQGDSANLTGQVRIELPGDVATTLHVATYAARSGLAGAVRRDDVDAGRIDFYGTYNTPQALDQSATTSRSQVALSFDRNAPDGSQMNAAVWAAYATYLSRLNFTGFEVEDAAAPGLFPGDMAEQRNDDAGVGARLLYRSRRLRPSTWLSATLSAGATGRAHTIEQAQDRLTEPDDVVWQKDIDATVRVSELGMWGEVAFDFSKYVHLRGGARGDFASFDVADRLAAPPANAPPGATPGQSRTASGVAGAPRATLEVDALPWLRLIGSAGIGHRTPEALQLTDGEKVPFTIVDSYEVGVRVSDRSSVNLTAALFETKLSQDLSFEALEGSFETIGPTTRKGVVVSATATPITGFNASVSMTAVDARLDNPEPDATKVPFVPPVVVRADVGYRRPVATLWDKSVDAHLGYGATFLGPRPLTDSIDSPATFVVDASAGVKRDFLALDVDVTNLFDQKYAEQEYYYASNWHTGPSATAPVEHISPGAPFTLLVSLTLSL